MRIVLLSGCSGWRLWPLSNESRSKQFLKLISKGDGCRESMLQKVVRQIKEAGYNDNLYVVTTDAQADTIRNQIGSEIKTISEPARKDTFPAVALACESLRFTEGISDEETVVILPVDTCAGGRFYELIGRMDEAIRNENKSIALIGTAPTYPSAKYGYIVSDELGNITSFKEKPSETASAALIETGAYWNTGAFAFKLGYMIKRIEGYLKGIPIDSIDDFIRVYDDLPARSFDYEILENTDNMKLITYVGKWKDLGTWNTLTEEMGENNIGQAMQVEDCTNTHVINELSIPILVMGAKDMVVAASPDGILVSDKHRSSYIKPYVQKIETRPMYEERKWGEYKVLDYNQYEDGMKSLTKHLTISAGKYISYQKHFQRDEIWTIVDGTGDLLIDDEIRHVKRGDVAYIMKGQKHALRADKDEDLQFIEVQIGPELVEDDIERFEWEWN